MTPFDSQETNGKVFRHHPVLVLTRRVLTSKLKLKLFYFQFRVHILDVSSLKQIKQNLKKIALLLYFHFILDISTV